MVSTKKLASLSYESLLLEEEKLLQAVRRLEKRLDIITAKSNELWKSDITAEEIETKREEFWSNRYDAEIAKKTEEHKKYGGLWGEIFLGTSTTLSGKESHRLTMESYEYARLLKDEAFAKREVLIEAQKPLTKERKATQSKLSRTKERLLAVKALKPKKRRSERNARLKSFEDRAREGAQSIRSQLMQEASNPWSCPYCNKPEELTVAEADHIYPISKGGLSVLQNMILICKSCNSKKSNKTLRRFAAQQSLDYEEICTRLDLLGKDV